MSVKVDTFGTGDAHAAEELVRQLRLPAGRDHRAAVPAAADLPPDDELRALRPARTALGGVGLLARSAGPDLTPAVADETNRAVPPDPAAASGPAPARRTRRSRVVRRLAIRPAAAGAGLRPAGGLRLPRPALQLLARRTRGLRPEVLEEGLGLQDLGGRAGDGEPARHDAPDVPASPCATTASPPRSTAARERVVPSYEQHTGVPGCFGETEYFVTASAASSPECRRNDVDRTSSTSRRSACRTRSTSRS